LLIIILKVTGSYTAPSSILVRNTTFVIIKYNNIISNFYSNYILKKLQKLLFLCTHKDDLVHDRNYYFYHDLVDLDDQLVKHQILHLNHYQIFQF